jgi:hypothetical protein
MRHYRLTPVRLAPDGLQWIACQEAERERYAIEYDEPPTDRIVVRYAFWQWFADVNPEQHAYAVRVVAFLNAEQ